VRLDQKGPPRSRAITRSRATIDWAILDEHYPVSDQISCRGRKTEGVDMEVIGVIIAGIIIGLLGKWVAPGDRDNIPLWLTVLCGIGGVLIGYYVAAAFGVEDTPGIDWIRWLISIAVAAVLVIIAATLTARRGSRRVP
jgi:uncharacterized membrane protein YeaQ/YmgE (transglycosylase-associated protein family)